MFPHMLLDEIWPFAFFKSHVRLNNLWVLLKITSRHFWIEYFNICGLWKIFTWLHMPCILVFFCFFGKFELTFVFQLMENDGKLDLVVFWTTYFFIFLRFQLWPFVNFTLNVSIKMVALSTLCFDVWILCIWFPSVLWNVFNLEQNNLSHLTSHQIRI